jgi:hypothetical protein
MIKTGTLLVMKGLYPKCLYETARCEGRALAQVLPQELVIFLNTGIRQHSANVITTHGICGWLFMDNLCDVDHYF